MTTKVTFTLEQGAKEVSDVDVNVEFEEINKLQTLLYTLFCGATVNDLFKKVKSQVAEEHHEEIDTARNLVKQTKLATHIMADDLQPIVKPSTFLKDK